MLSGAVHVVHVYMYTKKNDLCTCSHLRVSSGGERERISRQMAGGGLYENQKDLQQHCTMVSETFFRSFVKCKRMT